MLKRNIVSLSLFQSNLLCSVIMLFDAHDTTDQKVTLGMVKVWFLNKMIMDMNSASKLYMNFEEFGETVRSGSCPLQNG